MKKTTHLLAFRVATLAVLASGSGTVHAQLSEGITRHSLQNSNTAINSGVDVNLLSSNDFYMNEINVAGGAGWDAGFDVNFNGSYFDRNANAFGNYTFGDLISGNQDWLFGGLFGGMFALGFNAPVALGTYSTTFEVLGGATSSSTDVLLSFTEIIDVVDFGLVLSSPDSNIGLPPGGSAMIRHNLHNTGTEEFRINSRYISWSMPGIDQFAFEFSNTYPNALAPSENLTNVDHVRFDALPSFVNPFTFSSGVIGGLYEDDTVWLEAGSHTLTPVPEPATMTLFASAVLVGLRRRRSQRK